MSESGENGVYVLQTYGPEFRIALMEAVENIYQTWDENTETWTPNADFIHEQFGDSLVYNVFEDAWDAATTLEHQKETTFGVNLIKDFDTKRYSDFENGKDS